MHLPLYGLGHHFGHRLSIPVFVLMSHSLICGAGLTTSQARHVIQTIVGTSSESYASSLKRGGSREVERATMLVIHAHQADFLQLLDAVASYMDFCLQDSREEIFAWIDVLCLPPTEPAPVSAGQEKAAAEPCTGLCLLSMTSHHLFNLTPASTLRTPGSRTATGSSLPLRIGSFCTSPPGLTWLRSDGRSVCALLPGFRGQ